MTRVLHILALCALLLPVPGSAAEKLPDDRKLTENLRHDLQVLWKSDSPEKELQSDMRDAGLRGPMGRRRYTQAFDGGENVLGLLPGRGKLANEYVIVAVDEQRE